MTKKRRNLRILASIIAAGCVWMTGMASAWADPEPPISLGTPQNYVAIGTHENVFTTIIPEATAEDGDIIAVNSGIDNGKDYYAVTIKNSLPQMP